MSHFEKHNYTLDKFSLLWLNEAQKYLLNSKRYDIIYISPFHKLFKIKRVDEFTKQSQKGPKVLNTIDFKLPFGFMFVGGTYVD